MLDVAVPVGAAKVTEAPEHKFPNLVTGTFTISVPESPSTTFVPENAKEKVLEPVAKQYSPK